MACDHFMKDIKNGKFTALNSCIGTPEFNIIMKNRLDDLLKHIKYGRRERQDRVLELMAGVGRNHSVLKDHFRQVEMLEQSDEMYKHIPLQVKVHKTRI